VRIRTISDNCPYGIVVKSEDALQSEILFITTMRADSHGMRSLYKIFLSITRVTWVACSDVLERNRDRQSGGKKKKEKKKEKEKEDRKQHTIFAIISYVSSNNLCNDR